MTEEIIKSIAAAEEEAAKIKLAATENAAKILKSAEIRAAEIEKTSGEVCKAYRKSSQKNAEAAAEKEYLETIEKARADAQEYCRKILSNTETAVSKIVGRITSGDC